MNTIMENMEKPKKISKIGAQRKECLQFRSALLGLSGFHLCQIPEIKNITGNYKYTKWL